MQHIALDKLDEVVKRFVLSLPIDPQGTILELDGHAVALVVSPGEANASGDDEPWTGEMNDRRCDLIDRKYADGISSAEALELALLQRKMQRWRQRVAPLPLEDARRLHQELLELAAVSRAEP